jgi:Enterobacter phage Enc34, ssDNA-binding protein
MSKSSSLLISPRLLLESSSLVTPKSPPRAPEKDPEYFARLLVPEAAIRTTAWQEFVAGIDAYGRDRFGPTYPKNIKSPLRRDIPDKGWPTDIVCFLTAKTGVKFKPGLYDRDREALMDPAAELYPGCFVRVSVKPWGYDNQYGRGVSLDLDGLQKLSDGPRLAMARGDGSEFGDLDPDDDIMN